jgi:hypothetical protein
MTEFSHTAQTLHRSLDKNKQVRLLRQHCLGEYTIFSYIVNNLQEDYKTDLGESIFSNPQTSKMEERGFSSYQNVDEELSKPVFAIGDVHGHGERLVALLLSQGLISLCSCMGKGCSQCYHSGYIRSEKVACLVQLGDLGHFGDNGNAAGDHYCYQLAQSVFDVVLWGNHDRAVVSPTHHFNHFSPPEVDTFGLVANEVPHKLGFIAQGFLLTHSGLHRSLLRQNLNSILKAPRGFIAAINRLDGPSVDELTDLGVSPTAITLLQEFRDSISAYRGGAQQFGGILWRDTRESLYPVRQVFGHTKSDKVRRYMTPGGMGYCIDLGTPHNGRLAGIWLPEEQIVEVIRGKISRRVLD